MEQAVNIMLGSVAAYLICGLLFAIPFVIKGIVTIDPDGARGANWSFRLIIIPGTMVFWPLLLKKWINASKNKHDQTTA